MRRVATVLGSVAAAGALALGCAGSAMAAPGTLTVNGKEYSNPSGCYTSARWPLSVTNRTSKPAFIFSGSNCTGRVLKIVSPGSGAVSEFGGSVYVE